MKKIWLGLLSVAVSINLYGADKVYTTDELYMIVKHENTDFTNRRLEKQLIGEKVSGQCEVTEVDEVTFGDGYEIDCEAPSGKMLSLETQDIKKIERVQRGEYVNFSGGIKAVKAENDLMNIQTIIVDLDLDFTSGDGDVHNNQTRSIDDGEKTLNITKDQWTKDHKISLPFVGKAPFSFSGGNGNEKSIVIKENGDTEISSCGAYGCTVLYTGKFKKNMEGYTFTSTSVSMVSESGSIIKTCDEFGTDGMDEHYPCTQSLDFDYKIETNTKNVNISQDVLDNYAYKFLGGYYTTNGDGRTLWSSSNLVKKTNSKGVKIYCLSYKDVCKIEAEIMDYINQESK